MTVVFDDQAMKPGTHALLIGVGDYPLLLEGSTPEAQRFEHHMKMGQLSSPPHSIKALADWLRDEAAGFNNPERPLRSMEILCSAATPFSWAPPDGAAQPIERASMVATRRAINEWKVRASRDPDNMALFYFCGHGLQFSPSENALLLDDFGSDLADPMTSAISFGGLRLGLQRQCTARFQCHFIDACRTAPTKAFLDAFGGESSGARVVAGALTREIRERLAPVFYATGLLSAAYGQPNQPSIFMQGMLKCFRGVGSREAVDHYAVTCEAIAEGINKCVESLAFSQVPQYCQPQEAGYPVMLHRIRGDPEVMVKLYTKDEGLLPNVILSHTNQVTNSRVERQPQPAPWWIPLPLGMYLFEAKSAAGAAVIGQLSRHVSPPGAQVGL